MPGSRGEGDQAGGQTSYFCDSAIIKHKNTHDNLHSGDSNQSCKFSSYLREHGHAQPRLQFLLLGVAGADLRRQSTRVDCTRFHNAITTAMSPRPVQPGTHRY